MTALQNKLLSYRRVITNVNPTVSKVFHKPASRGYFLLLSFLKSMTPRRFPGALFLTPYIGQCCTQWGVTLYRMFPMLPTV